MNITVIVESSYAADRIHIHDAQSEFWKAATWIECRGRCMGGS